MAEEEKKNKPKKPKSSLIGAQATPTTLDSATKVGIDVDKAFADDIIYAAEHNMLDSTALDNFTSISNNRDQIYQLIDTMMQDSSVSAIVRTYAEDVCEMADSGHIMWCESKDPKVSLFVNYLLGTINVDKYAFGWVYSLCEYGDVYLRLYRESESEDRLFDRERIASADAAKTRLNESQRKAIDKTPGKAIDESVYLNIRDASDHYSGYIEAVPDPGTMFELTKVGKTYGYIETPNQKNGMNYLSDAFNGSSTTLGAFNYRMKTNDVNVYQADDFVHICLDDSPTRFPEQVDIFLTDDDYKAGEHAMSYTVRRGKSMLYDSYKIWREKSLLENAALLNRITRSSVVRTIQIEVGNMPKANVQNTLRRVKDMMEQKAAISTNGGMAEYNNPGAFENNIYLATHGGIGAISIGTVGGDVDVKNLADLDYWNNKFYSSYGIPKSYFGWTDDAAGFNGGSALTILSSVYAKGVKRVQNAFIQAMTDAVNLMLLDRGMRSYVNKFTLKMRAPSTQEEKDYREQLTQKISAISNMQSLFADIEDKENRLKILKTLLAPLNYGEELLAVLDDEIAAAQKAKEEEAAAKAAEAAEAEAEGQGEEPMGELPPEEPPEGEEPPAEGDFDLGSSAEAPMESLRPEGGETLFEGQDLLGDTDDLPMPEELNAHKDFSKNE